MKKRTTFGLMKFLAPSDEPISFLVVESLEYLPLIRRAVPNAELAAVTENEDAPRVKEWEGLNVSWEILDYTAEPLPFPRESFDYILSEHLLELAGNPQDIAAGFSRFIKPTGALLTSFENIRWWKILDNLKDGHFYALAHRLFAREDFRTLLYASFYKEVSFLPETSPGPDKLLDELERAGFSDREDMNTENWLVIAHRSMQEVASLKARYTPKIRRQLVTLLRRIEYGIDLKENRESLKSLCEAESIDEAYVRDFAEQTVFWGEQFERNIRE